MTSKRLSRTLATLAIVALIGALAIAMSPATGAQETVLTYTIKEARTYAYKVSLTKEIIEAAGPCEDDPRTPYNDCDKSVHTRTPNCPTSIALAGKKAPEVTLPGGALPASGGSGDALGTDPSGGSPPQANPVRLSELIPIAHMGNLGAALESGGLSSDTYVDLDGRQNPEAHTESDGFSPNLSRVEERCWSGWGDDDKPNQIDPSSYAHLLSRSGAGPNTYHLAECKGEQCSRSQSTDGRPSFDEARMIVSLFESGGKIFGRMSAMVSEITFQQGVLSVDSVTSYLAFESDGTENGLKWTAFTSASGVKIGGQPVKLPPGTAVGGPALPGTETPLFYVGLAGPYVRAAEDGTSLTMIAPGLYIGTDQQASFIGGAETYAGMGRVPPQPVGTGPTLTDPGFDTITTTGTQPIPSIGNEPEGGGPVAPSAGLPEREGGRTVAVSEHHSGPLAMASILGTGAVLLLLLLAGWARRFEWARRLYSIQPFKTFDWLYRAFLQT